MIGLLERTSGRFISGWAAARNGETRELIVSVNGTSVARFRPLLPRLDLVNQPGETLGFHFEMPTSLEIGDTVAVTNSRNEHLVGSPHRVTALVATREEKIRWLIGRSMKVLEIGPSFNPIVPKSDGWNSSSLDHATQEELRQKYRGQQPVERIEPVDYLWKGGPLETAIPESQHGQFDAVIASHVIEHIPDLIGFFQSVALLLKTGGLLSLAIPDKRTMFDYFKGLTMTSDLLAARAVRRTRHSKKTAFDNVAYNVSRAGNIAFALDSDGELSFCGTDVLSLAQHAFDNTTEDESSPYVDFHATVYTPASFSLIILELGQLGALPFVTARTFPTSGCEFFVTLRKGRPELLDSGKLQSERLQLMKLTIQELSEQAKYLGLEG